ncbi:hypothetical protein K488DRAFT_46154 [Vararia minispora EC-137]|uniref:Uncharacterized protein n=1 Tax=Vararia minispora EC-137 TaxID=1314806 RepID=A0ACB8QQP1_9AGAM|nr:hypothetical protein K488DRAFT_46154 [Vararia minispora EC-137]
MAVFPRLPIELWIHVLDLATRPSDEPNICYVPFDINPSFQTCSSSETRTRSAIVLVCKQWRAIGLCVLYRDLFIRDNLHSLMHTIPGSSQPKPGFRNSCVRRVILPYTQTAARPPSAGPCPAVMILEACPNVEVLVRPQCKPGEMFRLQFDHPMSTPSLLSVRRLDWWHDHFAYRTGGINYLPDVIHQAPNIEYLTLAGDMLPNTFIHRGLELPKLKVLRLRGVNPIYIRHITTWHFPSLTHVVLESLYQSFTFSLLRDAIARQIECVELGRHMHFLTFDLLSMIISGCPNLRELNFYVFFALPPLITDAHTALQRLGLHAAPNVSMEERISPWQEIWAHARAFTNRETFPSLSEVVLYGKYWDNLIHGLQAEDEFHNFKHSFEALGISVTMQQVGAMSSFDGVCKFVC